MAGDATPPGIPLWSRMNLPNKLTVARFLLTMIFLVLSSYPEQEDGGHLWVYRIAFALAIVAGFTDFLDGYLARKYGLITDFGKLMDPLADKIFTVSCFVILTEHQAVPGWITVLILTREFAVTGLRTFAANKGQVMAASFIGKMKTLSQMLVLLLGGFIFIKVIPFPGPAWFHYLWNTLITIVALVTVYTGVEYYVRGRDLYLHQMR
jgi:CDP-diacylglycerol--glycerol-3-phosphate 3-phosphatidyltransferase